MNDSNNLFDQILLYAPIYLRLALGITFFTAVADRFGLWGPPGSANVAWGDFQHFLDYVATLNPYLPESLIAPLGWIVTVAESVLGTALIVGFRTRITALLSGFLLLAFALGVTIALGIKAPLNYSVFSASAGAFLLAAWQRREFSSDSMSLQDRARFWNVTTEERGAAYPCDSYFQVPYQSFLRAIDVETPPEVLFRWLCQLKVAPYSYDWIDNLGRQSPRELTPGAGDLKVGQSFMVFEIVDFEPDRHISGIVHPRFERIFGPLAISYIVRPKSERTCRLVAKLNVGASGFWERIRRALLAWGDLIMMRKQLLTLKELAEHQAMNGPSPNSKQRIRS